MVVGKCQDIPDMLRTANNQLQGKLKYVIKDIEGCYPNMPKDAIRTSMKTVLEEMDLNASPFRDFVSRRVPCGNKVHAGLGVGISYVSIPVYSS